MAIAIAREGGIGVLHKNMTIDHASLSINGPTWLFSSRGLPIFNWLEEALNNEIKKQLELKNKK